MKIDIIGDIHGCLQELKELTRELGYSWSSGIPIHQEDRMLGFVGDLTDRGPDSLKVIEIVWQLVIKDKRAYYTPGNHCNKLYRFFLGNKVQIAHGLETTVAEYESLYKKEQQSIRKKFIELYEKAPLYLVLDNQKDLLLPMQALNRNLSAKPMQRSRSLFFTVILQVKSIPTVHQ